MESEEKGPGRVKKKRTRKESHWHDGQASGYDWIERSTRLAIYLRDHNECLACGNTDNLTLDHLRRDLPKNEVHKPTNLVTLCLTCNSSRRNADPATWDPRFAEVAYFQVRQPIDRKEGLRLARDRWPARYAKKEARQKKKQRASSRSSSRRASGTGA